MSVPQHTSPVLGIGAFGLLVGGVLLIIALVAVRQDHREMGAAPNCGPHLPTSPTGRWFAVAPFRWRRSVA
jgi:hypothetical protein